MANDLSSAASDHGVYRRSLIPPHFLIAALVLATGLSCDSGGLDRVSKSDDKNADFGRASLVNAVVEFTKTPDSPAAYAAFAKRVEELRPSLNRESTKDAELRLSFLAIPVLAKGLSLTPKEQMQRFATTVWPIALGLPAADGESPEDYVRRLCLSTYALDCKNVVPEYWPQILSAKVWRTMKSRAAVAYENCRWCSEDPSFNQLMTECNESHLQVEIAAKEAQVLGQPSAWPTAGANATPLTARIVVSVRRDGWISIQGRASTGRNWREDLAEARKGDLAVGFHLPPERMVSSLTALLDDAKEAGYDRVALVVRRRDFPYKAMQYLLKSSTTTYQHLGVHKSDTIQILVQALDLAAAKAPPDTPL